MKLSKSRKHSELAVSDANSRRRPSFAALVMTFISYPLVFIWTAVCIVIFPAAITIWKIITRWDNGRIMRLFVWIYGRGWLVIMAPFVRFNRQGMQHFPKNESYIIVVNHYSFFDTYCMALLPVYNIIFAVRSWPFRIIWYRFFMNIAGYLNVEDNDWDKVESAGRKALESGINLLFYPEGHRSRDGRLQPFFSGAFRLANKHGAKIVPICISGTDELLPPGRWWFSPAKITIKALSPLDGSDFAEASGHKELQKWTRKRMMEELCKGTT